MNLFTRAGKLLVSADGTKLRLCCCPEPCGCCIATPNVIHAQVPTLTPPDSFGTTLKACIASWSGQNYTLLQGVTTCDDPEPPPDPVGSPCIWGKCQTCDYDDTGEGHSSGKAFLYQSVIFDCSEEGLVSVFYFVSFQIIGFATSCSWVKTFASVDFDCSNWCESMCDADRQSGCDTSFFSGCSNVGPTC